MRHPGGGARVIVAGVSADVIPAFHVANLAVAAAARGVPVRIFERSGLPVNAGCFLGLDPSCWVASPNGTGFSVAAFAGVMFEMAPGSDTLGDEDPEPWDGVEFLHAPTCDTGFEHAEAIAAAIARADVPMTVLYLAERDPEPCPWRNGDGPPDVARRVAYVTRSGRNGDGDRCVGSFTRWSGALADPVPVVVRDPGSRLARQYAGVASSILADTIAPAPILTDERTDSSHAPGPFKPR